VSTELEWSNLLPPGTLALDDDGSAVQDQYAPDSNIAVSATHHSSPVSIVRTPPDFSAVGMLGQHHHHQQFRKQLDGGDVAAACFDLGEAGEVLAYHAGFEIQDPFGLDASLFSI
jgi:hypothetical protein